MQAVPLLPLAAARQRLAAPLIDRSSAWQALQQHFSEVALREPPLQESQRWVEHRVAGRLLRFAQPLTLTPYASAKPCSARCAFCSETLKREPEGAEPAPMAAQLRPGARYFEHLREALQQLQGLPLAYSLSGLEATDDLAWFSKLLDTLQQLRDGGVGPEVEGAVLYTNGNGLVGPGQHLAKRLQHFGLTRIEWSRHHVDAARNQAIMRFRPGLAVADNAPLEAAIRAFNAHLPVHLVCVVQAGGVDSPQQLAAYVDWAQALGVQRVIFRELSTLPGGYADNRSHRYVDSARLCVAELAQDCLRSLPGWSSHLQPLRMTSGYYFSNACWQLRGGPELVFEASDYGALHAHEAAGRVYKLVFHANGHLCAGWQPERQVLWRPGDV